MSSPRRRRAALTGVVVGSLLLAGCGGGGQKKLTDPDDVPPKQLQPSTEVSVCDLVPPKLASAALDRPLEVVGVEYGPSRVPTYRCQLGDEFGVAELTVELAVGPVSRNVFNDAYGDSAGGDPVLLKRLGGIAYLRNEKDEQILHVYLRGTALSLRLVVDRADPPPRRGLLDLAHVAVNRVPSNPRLAPTAPGPRCSAVSTQLVEAVIGVVPARAAGLAAPDGSVTCSWASLPGSVGVTVIDDADRVRDYRKTLDASTYIAVDGLGPGVTALSRDNRPGDLILFTGRDQLALISVTPSAGYPDDLIVTTPDEVALARAVVTTLM